MRGCRPWSDKELSEYEQAFSGRYRLRNLALFVLGSRSGFRVSELLSLKVGDVYSNGHIVDRVSVARRHMKGKKQSRSVYLHPKVKPYLRQWLYELRQRGFMLSSDWLFVRDDGLKPISRHQVWRILKDLARSLGHGGKIGTHSMRKTFANKVWIVTKGNLILVQKALGHIDINSTVSYLSFREEDIDRAIKEAF